MFLFMFILFCILTLLLIYSCTSITFSALVFVTIQYIKYVLLLFKTHIWYIFQYMYLFSDVNLCRLKAICFLDHYLHLTFASKSREFYMSHCTVLSIMVYKFVCNPFILITLCSYFKDNKLYQNGNT